MRIIFRRMSFEGMSLDSYPSQVAGLLYNRPHAVGRARFHISGYSEQGSTTSPWLVCKICLEVSVLSLTSMHT